MSKLKMLKRKIENAGPYVELAAGLAVVLGAIAFQRWIRKTPNRNEQASPTTKPS